MMKPGDTLGRYQIEALLARGGMAEVWLAQSTGIGGFKKKVVVKTILPHLADNPDFVAMFINEALLAARLNHPNIVQIFDLGHSSERHYIAMEFVPGKTLRQIARRYRERKLLLPPWFILRVMVSVCEGLQFAHDHCDESGVPLALIHRDVTPENVMVSYLGAVKILDFGVAKACAAAPLTRAQTLKGKYAYISPEQIQGATPDRRADIYSVGIVLYELLTGCRPFRGTNDLELLRNVIKATPTPPREHAPWMPGDLEQIILHAMAADPAERYSNATALGSDLLDLLRRAKDQHDQRALGELVADLDGEGAKNGTSAKEATPSKGAVDIGHGLGAGLDYAEIEIEGADGTTPAVLSPISDADLLGSTTDSPAKAGGAALSPRASAEATLTWQATVHDATSDFDGPPTVADAGAVAPSPRGSNPVGKARAAVLQGAISTTNQPKVVIADDSRIEASHDPASAGPSSPASGGGQAPPETPTPPEVRTQDGAATKAKATKPLDWKAPPRRKPSQAGKPAAAAETAPHEAAPPSAPPPAPAPAADAPHKPAPTRRKKKASQASVASAQRIEVDSVEEARAPTTARGSNSPFDHFATRQAAGRQSGVFDLAKGREGPVDLPEQVTSQTSQGVGEKEDSAATGDIFGLPSQVDAQADVFSMASRARGSVLARPARDDVFTVARPTAVLKDVFSLAKTHGQVDASLFEAALDVDLVRGGEARRDEGPRDNPFVGAMRARAPEQAPEPVPDERENEAEEQFRKGLALLRDGQQHGAVEAWERAVELAPDRRTYLANLRRLKKLLEDDRR